MAEVGQVVAGSTTVLIGGQPAATAEARCAACAELPAQLQATATTVLIG